MPSKPMTRCADAMRVHGYRLVGAKREIYLNQMLEIQFPLKPA